ncbi:hypothetical protein CDL15_Pgr027301 [Punica granatum]|uniref:Uncharacterized protein n=1 Tax=Punica granatum TaxID=22663 RepID=A0A218XRQ6_PUNGR|nr:hypothetical protein CDL15_Pgr027301 [Punica granatum]PKI71838.1 hypothetical protein CRG98_007777 [Punica granatum]
MDEAEQKTVIRRELHMEKLLQIAGNGDYKGLMVCYRTTWPEEVREEMMLYCGRRDKVVAGSAEEAVVGVVGESTKEEGKEERRKKEGRKKKRRLGMGWPNWPFG